MNHTPTPVGEPAPARRRPGVVRLRRRVVAAAAATSPLPQGVRHQETTTTEKERSGGGIASRHPRPMPPRAGSSARAASVATSRSASAVRSSTASARTRPRARWPIRDPSLVLIGSGRRAAPRSNDCTSRVRSSPHDPGVVVPGAWKAAGRATRRWSTAVAEAVDGETSDIVREGINAPRRRSTELTLQAFDQCMPPEDITALLTEGIHQLRADRRAGRVATALEGRRSRVSELANGRTERRLTGARGEGPGRSRGLPLSPTPRSRHCPRGPSGARVARPGAIRERRARDAPTPPGRGAAGR